MTDTKKRLTVIAHEVRGDGGMEKAMKETIVGLLEQGWQITLFARVCELRPHPGLRWRKVPTPRRPFLIAFPLFALVAGVRLVFRGDKAVPVASLGAIVPNRVDIVTVQFCHAGFRRQSIIRASRGTWLFRTHNRIAKALALAFERWCYRAGRVRRMTAVSELVKEELEEHYQLASVPIDVIPNGVDPDRFRHDPDMRERERERLGLSEGELAALFVGGDWQRKGLEIAIAAVADAGWRLIVVGRGDEPAWAVKAQERGARVHFCGHLPDPANVFCAADAFILPSYYEGFALVVIEAAAAGLPLLVTDTTGAASLVDRSGGVTFPPDAGAFSAELKRLARHPDTRRQLARLAQEAAQDLAWPRIIPAYARAYGCALERADPRRAAANRLA
jgi:glycosyltransferase involved in cell wall biosynthesis